LAFACEPDDRSPRSDAQGHANEQGRTEPGGATAPLPDSPWRDVDVYPLSDTPARVRRRGRDSRW
jgi:hypothetical protein